jgi:hypothetical protein
VGQALHLLLVVNERAEAPHRASGPDGLLDHFDRPFDAEAKPIFVGQQNLHLIRLYSTFADDFHNQP